MELLFAAKSKLYAEGYRAGSSILSKMLDVHVENWVNMYKKLEDKGGHTHKKLTDNQVSI